MHTTERAAAYTLLNKHT